MLTILALSRHYLKFWHIAILFSSIALIACGGGGGGGGAGNSTTPPLSYLSLFAGNLGGMGFLDGEGSAAGFNSPQGIVTDSTGNVYVADTRNRTIRKITPGGAVTTLAGLSSYTGSADGTGLAARFAYPEAIAIDSSDNIFVADSSNHTIRKVTPAGVVSTFAGVAGTSGTADGTGSVARFNSPSGIATDSSNNIYVADTINHTIRKITPAGEVSTIAGLAGTTGIASGNGSTARFNRPQGISTDISGNIYVADSFNNAIRKITPAGTVTTLAGYVVGSSGISGSLDGTGAAAYFNYPQGVTTDSSNNIYVADTDNHTIRKITPAGVVSTPFGLAGTSGSGDGSGTSARFKLPAGIAMDTSGNMYVVDTSNHIIRKISSVGVVTTLAGSTPISGTADGIGSVARFNNPVGNATDSAGNVYVADTYNHAIRKITPTGDVTTVAGLAGTSGGADGAGSVARFNLPVDIASDTSDNLYVSDSLNNTIRKITPAGVVTTLAGLAGASGITDGSGPAARFWSPRAITTDVSGNVYVTDTNNHTLRKITSAGAVSTIAGLAGNSGSADGSGATARFNYPQGITIDSLGNLFVAGTNDNTIRKITPAGTVSTFVGLAGSPTVSANGIGQSAHIWYPKGMTIDSSDNIYVAEYNNHSIRKITPAGLVSTVVGAGYGGNPGFAAGNLPGVIEYPQDVAIHGRSLYILTRNGVAMVANLP